MKKNFLKIAALLIAAMLLVVSCSQEVKAPEAEDNGLVEAFLNTSAARSALTYSGLSIDNVKYRYRLTAQWKPEGADQDAVVGNTTGVESADSEGYIAFDNDETKSSQGLGYVSQGLWQVDVIGSIGEGGAKKDVLKGTTKVYFNKTSGSDTVTVYVKPIDTASSAQITLNVKVNDHDSGSAYKLYYSIEDVKGDEIVGETEMNKTESVEKGYRLWSIEKTGLNPGYYRVTVTMKNGEDVVGGLTTGVLLFAGDTSATLSGSVNSKDFINGTLNVFYPNVKVTITPSAVTKTDNKYHVTYTATASIENHNGLANNVQPTYTWYADGVPLTNENNASTYEGIYDEPGNKTVTCVATYTLNVPNYNNTGDNTTVAFVVQGSNYLTTLVQ